MSSALVPLTHVSTAPLVFCVRMLPHLHLAEAGERAHPRAAQVPGTENTHDHPRPHPFSIPFPIPDSRPLCPCLGPAGDNHGQPQHLRASKSSEPITSRHARLPSAFLPRKPRKRSAPPSSRPPSPAPPRSFSAWSPPGMRSVSTHAVSQGKASPDLLAYHYSHIINMLCL